jgi:hypothetical protein
MMNASLQSKIFNQRLFKKQKFKGWRCGSSSRAPPLQAESPKLKPQYPPKRYFLKSTNSKNNSVPLLFLVICWILRNVHSSLWFGKESVWVFLTFRNTELLIATLTLEE